MYHCMFVFEMQTAIRRKALLGLLWVNIVVSLNLALLSFVSINALFDPAGLAASVQNGYGDATAQGSDMTRLSCDLARSSGPTALAIAFACARSLWRSVSDKRDTVILLTVFHAANVLVIGVQLWERASTDMASPVNQTAVAEPRGILSSADLVDLIVAFAVFGANALAIVACREAMALSTATGSSTGQAADAAIKND